MRQNTFWMQKTSPVAFNLIFKTTVTDLDNLSCKMHVENDWFAKLSVPDFDTVSSI